MRDNCINNSYNNAVCTLQEINVQQAQSTLKNGHMVHKNAAIRSTPCVWEVRPEYQSNEHI